MSSLCLKKIPFTKIIGPYKKDAQKITRESVRKYISMAVTKLHKGRNSLREENNGKTQFYVA